MNPKRRVVIIGGGFGGLYAARSLKRAPFEVTLVDKRNFHLFQPLLYQVATGGLSPGDVSSPLRYLLRSQRNAEVLLAEAVDFDLRRKIVFLSDGELPYDYLVVAPGAQTHYFGNPTWQSRAPGLKTVEDATEIRRRILSAFEAAERESDPEARRSWLSFAVIGGGPTGVELAGTLAELARDTLPRDFRRVDTTKARILLIEGKDRILPAFPEELSRKAEKSLRKLGIEIRTNALITSIGEDTVALKTANGVEEIRARTILWGAGVRASRLGKILADGAGAEMDSLGRIVVESDLSLPKHPEVFVIGDLAHYAHGTGIPLPGIAPVAMQQGRYVARLLAARLHGGSLKPFRYRDRGNLATIGRSRAVGQIGRLRLSGLPAWILWVIVHIYYLIEFENRLLVLLQWAWNYVTWNRSARLITGKSPLPPTASDMAQEKLGDPTAERDDRGEFSQTSSVRTAEGSGDRGGEPEEP
jgi:NADH dehydrogenase